MYKKWEVYTRGTVPLHRIDLFEDLRKSSLVHNKDYFCNVLYAHENGKLWWAWDRKGVEEWWRGILRKVLDEDKTRREHYKKYDIYCRQAIGGAEKIRKIGLGGLTDGELIKLYDFLEKEASSASGFPNIDLDVFDIYFENFLQEKIKEKLGPGNKAFSRVYRELSAPIHKTFISQEEEAVIKLALKKKNKQSEIQKVYDNFWWVGLGWENIIPRSPDHYSQEVEKYRKKKNIQKNLFNIQNRPSSIKKTRQGMIKKYQLGREIKDLLDIFDKFAYFHDLRKETQVRVAYSFYLLLNEAARRLDIKDEDKEWFSHKEIKDILKGGKADLDEIRKRKESILVLVEKDGIKFLSGSAASNKRKSELDYEIAQVSEFKGVGVTKGKVKATVRVCNGIEDALKKMEKGDVLVTGMTLPDYVPVMKLAGAIITNEGGITCHAAIVSRELGIPCIVGTKIATQVLHDGDLVEVDADKGVVRIIKKAENENIK